MNKKDASRSDCLRAFPLGAFLSSSCQALELSKVGHVFARAYGVPGPAAGPPPRAFPLRFRERHRGLKNLNHATGVRFASARLFGQSVSFTPTSWFESAAFIRRISHATQKPFGTLARKVQPRSLSPKFGRLGTELDNRTCHLSADIN